MNLFFAQPSPLVWNFRRWDFRNAKFKLDTVKEQNGLLKGVIYESLFLIVFFCGISIIFIKNDLPLAIFLSIIFKKCAVFFAFL